MNGTRSLLERTLADLHAAEDEGDVTRAAAACERLAALWDRFSQEALSAEARQRRAGSAATARQRAADLRSGQERLNPCVAAARGTGGASLLAGMAEVREAVETLIDHAPVRWDDIGGLEQTKREIISAYALALARKPDGVRIAPPRNILLFGPPGTGKTMLAAAASHELEATFFNARLGGLLSKFFGESSKLVEVLYSVAREKAPSVVFIDELDALCRQRGGDDSGAERRVLGTFLATLDGFTSKGEEALVLTVAATNVPWELDAAVLSRFDKRIYVPLPDRAARRQILRLRLEARGHVVTCSWEELIDLTEGCSGRDLVQACEATLAGVLVEMNPTLAECARDGIGALRALELKTRPLTLRDFERAFATRPGHTSLEPVKRFEQWIQGTCG